MRCSGAGSDQPATRIGAGQPDRADAGGGERRHETRIDRSRQHADDDVERGVVGDAQAVDLVFLDPGHLQRRIDLLAAAVNDRPPDRRAARCGTMAATTVRSRAGSSSSSPPNFRHQARRSQQAGRLRLAEHDVHVLHGLTGRALQQVVDHGDEDRPS